MIEFLAPRDGAFGPADAGDFVGFDGDDGGAGSFDEQPPPSRWLRALAVVALAGMFTGGLLAAAPWEDDTATSPDTTLPIAPTDTTAGTDGRVRTASSAARGLPAGTVTTPTGWVLDEPGRFIAIDAGSNGSYVGPGDGFDLWLNAVASRTTGAFIAIDARVLLASETIREGAASIMAGDRPALVWTAPDGVIEIQVATDDAGFVVTSGGVALPDLIAVAATLTIDATERGTFDYHGLDAAADGPFSELIRAVDGEAEVSVDAAQVGTALSWTRYVDPSRNMWLQFVVLATGRDEQLINDLVLSRPLPEADYGRDDTATLDRLIRGGRLVGVRISTSGSDRPIARMQLGDGTQLMVTGDVELHDLLSIVGRVQPASDEAWRALLADTSNGVSIGTSAADESVPVVFPGEPVESWQASLFRGRFEIAADDATGLSQAFTPGPEPDLVEYRTIRRSFLRATDTGLDSARSIVVTQQGRDAIIEPLIEVDRSGVFVVVLEVDATLPYSVQWLDGDGLPVPGPAGAAP